MSESGLVIDCLRAFSHRKFLVLDPKTKKEGIAYVLRSFSPFKDNGVVWRSNVGGLRIGRRFVQFGIAGSPDIMGVCRDGIFIGCECKLGSAQLSVAQEPFHATALVCGARVFVARSYEECLQELKGYGY